MLDLEMLQNSTTKKTPTLPPTEIVGRGFVLTFFNRAEHFYLVHDKASFNTRTALTRVFASITKNS